MFTTLIRLPPGMPFVIGSTLYYREFSTKLRTSTMVKCFSIVKGIVQFKQPHYFPSDLEVQVYEFTRNNPT